MLRAAPVAWFVIVTSALGMAASVLSSTVPCKTDAAVACPKRLLEVISNKTLIPSVYHRFISSSSSCRTGFGEKRQKGKNPKSVENGAESSLSGTNQSMIRINVKSDFDQACAN